MSGVGQIAGLQAPSAGAASVVAANEPAAVRDGSPQAKQAYETARSFEELLMTQLSQQLVQSSGLESEGSSAGGEETGGEEQPSGSGSSTMSSLLPQVLTESVMRGGGLGLANQLTAAIDPAAGAPASAANGTASATPSGGVAS
jgi:Rod binding domain-containing protein